MNVRIVLGGMLMLAVVAGAALYYLQVYAFYDRLTPAQVGDIRMVSVVSGEPEPILADDVQAIDSDSSPIRFRACFQTAQSLAMLTETYEIYDHAEPLNAPDWFECFDAKAIGAALESGQAVAFLGQKHVSYGVDRVIAVLPDGRGYVWPQINPCGEAVFDGDPAPQGCPTPPERMKN